MLTDLGDHNRILLHIGLEDDSAILHPDLWLTRLNSCAQAQEAVVLIDEGVPRVELGETCVDSRVLLCL
jgi:hypothetical protein